MVENLVWLLRDPALPRPGPLQSDWVRRGLPRGGQAVGRYPGSPKSPSGAAALPTAVSPGANSGSNSPSLPAASTPGSTGKRLSKSSSAPAASGLPKVSPSNEKLAGGGQAAGLSSPGGPRRKSSNSSVKKMPVDAGASSTASTRAPSPRPVMSTLSALNKVKKRAGKGFGKGAGATQSQQWAPSRSATASPSRTTTAESAARLRLVAPGTPENAGASEKSQMLSVTSEGHPEEPIRPGTPATGGGGSRPPTRGTAASTETSSKTRGSRKSGSSRVWVALEGPAGESTKVRVKFNISINEFRKVVAGRTAIPLRHLQLRIGEKVLEEARRPAFEDMDSDDMSNTVVNWWRDDRIKMLMDRRKLADYNSRGWLGRTLLHYCVLDGDFTLCMAVCNEDWSTDLLNVQDLFGDTALMFASISGFDDIVELLMDRQAEPDHMNLCGRTALMIAAEHGQHRIERTLLAAGAKRGPNIGYSWPDEVYLAEVNDHEKVLSSIRVFELAEAAVVKTGNERLT